MLTSHSNDSSAPVRDAPSAFKIRLSDCVRRRREAFGWSQADLAKRSGVGEATVGRFESRQKIQFDSLAKVLTALGMADSVIVELWSAQK